MQEQKTCGQFRAPWVQRGVEKLVVSLSCSKARFNPFWGKPLAVRALGLRAALQPGAAFHPEAGGAVQGPQVLLCAGTELGWTPSSLAMPQFKYNTVPFSSGALLIAHVSTCGGSYGTITLCRPVTGSSTYCERLLPSTRMRWLAGADWPVKTQSAMRGRACGLAYVKKGLLA